MTKPTVLVADDDRAMRVGLGLRLSAMGFRVVEVDDGLGVMSRCGRERPDVILLDHQMPNGDGRAIARVIRYECDAPIVFVSGHTPDDFRTIVTELPDVYYLSKPIDHDRLRQLLASITEPAPAAIGAA